MSSTIDTNSIAAPKKKHFKFAAGIGVMGVAVAIAAGAIIPSGAALSASSDGNLNVTAATVAVAVQEGNLSMNNVVPGGVVKDSVYIQNPSTIPVNVILSSNGPVESNIDSRTAFSEFTLAVTNYRGFGQLKSLATESINLGSLAAGEGRWYEVVVGIDATAGNEVNGKFINVPVKYTLVQQ